jgi:hypothetical protein
LSFSFYFLCNQGPLRHKIWLLKDKKWPGGDFQIRADRFFQPGRFSKLRFEHVGDSPSTLGRFRARRGAAAPEQE